MIASEKHGFAFIHIPKNAGTSIREQLMEIDDFQSAFFRTKQHPELGSYDSGHVPLATLRDLFPDAFEKISGLTSYAIVRDPAERFLSALAQRSREFQRQLPDSLDEATIRAEVDKVIDNISSDRLVPQEFVHFTRQSDFIVLDDRQFVDHVYPIEAFDKLVAAIEGHLGHSMLAGFHVNKTVTYRYPALTGLLSRGRNLAKTHLPRTQYNWLRDRARNTFTKPGVSQLADAVRQSDSTMAFIRDHYRRDFEIYEAARRNSPLRADKEAA